MFTRLNRIENAYYITKKRVFDCNGILTENNILDCFEFAFDMTFGERGQHRNHRSGGNARRKKGEIFSDTFQGKLAEFVFYNYFNANGFNVSYPDMSTMGLNKWDGCDFEIDGYQIAIKSTKSFGNLLLLETKDWNSEGDYIPNLGTEHSRYDYFVLIRIRPETSDIMREKRWLYKNDVEYDELKKEIVNQNWEGNLVGYVSHDEIVDIINYKYILPQDALLNGRTKMDAENYYVQVGDMHYMDELTDILDEG